MDKYGELLSLIEEFLELETTIDIDEISKRAYEYYSDNELSSSEYDHVQRLLLDL